MVELTVADTGPGVSEEAAGRMFSPFFSTKPGGMGVGLGICRSIIELHRGRLWHTREPEGGSVFHIALPTARREDEP
jgi:signal transduction histidine kinase